MAKRTLNIAIRNQYQGYATNSIFMSILRVVSTVPVAIVDESKADMVIIGPYTPYKPLYRRVIDKATVTYRKKPKITVFHSGENRRHNTVQADYSISFDLGVESNRHFRAPNWWGSLDWSRFGINRSPSQRMRSLIDPEVLMQPLGSLVTSRPFKAALITSHLVEPRLTLYTELQKVLPVDGYGKCFDNSIMDHNSSGFFKEDILTNYMFSLCPENSMYPGYYTEKVPESFAAGCIPITWADQNITVDFLPGSYINMADFAKLGYAEALAQQLTSERLDVLCSTPLLDRLPDIEGYKAFVHGIVQEALR